MRAFVGLGGNLGDVPETLRAAARALDGLPGTRLLRLSALYRNPPMGPPGQPDYVNAVAEIATTLEPLALLDRLQALERAAGRERGAQRWQARTLDLDILLYGELEMDGRRLTLPHPGTHCRAFVIHPLAEIAPEVLVPGRGRAAELAVGVDRDGLRRLPAVPPAGA